MMSHENLEDIEQCTKCGICSAVCPVSKQLVIERYTPRGKIQLARFYSQNRLPLSERYREIYTKCLLCGACTTLCAGGLNPPEAVLKMRHAINREMGPDRNIKRLVDSIATCHNISAEDNEERGDWRDFMGALPEHGYRKDKAETAFFVGCVASFFPLVQNIPQNMARIMAQAKLDFSILGGEEWCCGFPLLEAGFPEEMRKLMDHNLAQVKALGAKEIVFTCPSCYRTWKEHYGSELELTHSSELINRLIQNGQIKFKKRAEMKVTYHDPCDLGRNAGIFEAPRQIIEAIPGLTLIELENNRTGSVCCGGGGNLESAAADLVEKLAQEKIAEIQRTRADILVTSCQQCIRTIATRARRQKIQLKAMDITELVVQALMAS